MHGTDMLYGGKASIYSAVDRHTPLDGVMNDWRAQRESS